MEVESASPASRLRFILIFVPAVQVCGVSNEKQVQGNFKWPPSTKIP